MPILAALALLLVVEIAAVVAVASWIGIGWTLLALLGFSLLGALLLRREGARAWRAFSAAVAAGRPPAREALDGMLVLLGALLIALPGFVSDVLGLLCILPPSRRLIGRALVGWALTRGRATIVRVRSSRGPGVDSTGPGPGPAAPGGGRVIEGEIEP
ncbi:MAG TPA: FxsA family protein [Mycobacteriales bacterium]